MASKGIKLKDVSNNEYYPCPYFPVGSIYMSVTDINPSTYFGGTWEQIKDVFLLACGSTYKAGATGGEATHQLTIEEMPSHTHTVAVHMGYDGGGNSSVQGSNGSYNWAHHGADWPSKTGGGKSHNNMPPYLAVYVWKRTA